MWGTRCLRPQCRAALPRGAALPAKSGQTQTDISSPMTESFFSSVFRSNLSVLRGITGFQPSWGPGERTSPKDPRTSPSTESVCEERSVTKKRIWNMQAHVHTQGHSQHAPRQ